MAKPKIALYWCAACGGCEEAVVDFAEGILDVVAAVDIAFWPVAMDFKKRDVEALADGELAATFLNGAIRTSEQEEIARLLRRKSRHLIAYGACAQLGGIPGLANQFSRERILRYVYEESPTVANPMGTRPGTTRLADGSELGLPEFRRGVRALDQVVAVDYFLPGCPPTPKLTRSAIDALLADRLPPRGTVLAPDVALCDQCPRKGTRPSDLRLDKFRRPHEVKLEPDRCLLAQGVVCMGPATRGGCEALCPSANMPCTGCFGPPSRVRDQGAKMLSSLSANLAARERADVAEALQGIPDPVGTFYRYGLARSLLRRHATAEADGNGPISTREGVAPHPSTVQP